MELIDCCPGCSGEISAIRKGLVSPFLARRIWARDPFPITLMKCTRCDLKFFNPRLEPPEESRLYMGYREPEYLAMRHSLEPWYTARFNANITNPGFLDLRKKTVSELLQTHLHNHSKSKILDFGGAHGELVAELIPGATPYVYDVSGVEPLAGVKGCQNLNACQNVEFDLILSSNVLEHLGNLRAVMEQMRGIASQHTMLWVEVPYESPDGSTLMMRRLAQHAVSMLLGPRIAFTLMRPGALCIMHEHVNFFGIPSLEHLLVTTGWKVRTSGTYKLNGPLGLQEWVWTLGKPAA